MTEQKEEEHERNLQRKAVEESRKQYEQDFILNKTEMQSYVPWATRAIYATAKEPTPQACYVQSKLAAMEILPQNVKVTPSSAKSQGKTESDLVQKGTNDPPIVSAPYQTADQVMNLSNRATIPFAAVPTYNANNKTNNNTNDHSVKDYGYGNGSIYSGKNHSIEEIYAYFEDFVVSLAKEAMNDLVGLAATIVGIIQTFAKLRGVTKHVVDMAILTLAACYIARQTQIGWAIEKERVLAQYPPTEEEKRKQVQAEKAAEIFMREAMAYFTQEWVGRIVGTMKESPKWELIASWGTEKVFEYLRKNTPSVTSKDIEDCSQYIKDQLSLQKRSPEGIGW